jgi:hypothetical protein
MPQPDSTEEAYVVCTWYSPHPEVLKLLCNYTFAYNVQRFFNQIYKQWLEEFMVLTKYLMFSFDLCRPYKKT